MRKIILFSLIVCLTSICNVFAGGFKYIETKGRCFGNECLKLSNNKRIECDNDKGDAGNGVTAVRWKNSVVTEIWQCEIAGDGDQWMRIQPSLCNADQESCYGGQDNKEFCWTNVNFNNYKEFADVELLDTKSTDKPCWRCVPGYKLKATGSTECVEIIEPNKKAECEKIENASWFDTGCHCKQGYHWKDSKTKDKCVPDGKKDDKKIFPIVEPACDGDVCAVFPDGGDVEKTICKGKDVGNECDASNATKGICINNIGHNKQKVISCAAKVCDDDSLLWLHKKSNGSYGAYGRCYKRNWLQRKYCDAGGEHCSKCKGKNSKCVLNVIKNYSNNGYGPTNAYHDDELCVCQSDSGNDGTVPERTDKCQQACQGGENTNECKCCREGKRWNAATGTCDDDDDNCPDGDCTYTLEVNIECANGVILKKNETISLTVEEAQKLRQNSSLMDALTKQGDVTAYIKREIRKYQDLLDIVCRDNGGYSVVISQNVAGLAEATKKLDSFFKDAEASLSGWRTADGKFNAMRLASDLSAGVVLGTVGGVVSGVVIKKKQLEKGYDALHCTVGGQNVADWGDTFEVGLRR